MAGGMSLKGFFSKPKVQWAIVIFLIVVFLIIIFISVKALRGNTVTPTQVIIGTPNSTVAAILTETAYATEHYFFPPTWTNTPTGATSLTPTASLTNTGAKTATSTLSRTPTRTKTPVPYRTATPIRTSTKIPTRTFTPTLTATLSAKLSISKLPATQSIGMGGTAIFNITITNSGTENLNNIIVTDAETPDCNRSIASLAVGSSSSYTCTKTAVTASFTNSIAVSGRNSNGVTVNASASATVKVVAADPHITISKTIYPATFNAIGQVLNYVFTITNDGNVPLTAVSGSDPSLTSLACTLPQPTSLAVGASYTCAASHVATQGDLDAGVFSNTATASGTPPNGPVVSGSVSNSAMAVQNPGILLTKEVTPATFSAVGQVLNYTLTATNNGNVSLTNVSISDPVLGALVCTQPVPLAPANTLVCTASHTITQADLDAGSFTNTASATGTPPSGSTVTSTATRSVPAVQNPAISLTKSLTGSPYSAIGDVLGYTLTATNAGNVTLTHVSITDGKLGTLDCTPAQPVTLAPAETLTCIASHLVEQNDLDYGSYYNTAVVSGTPPTGAAIIASDSKTAVASIRPDRVAASIDTDSDGYHEIVHMTPAGTWQVIIDLPATDMHLGGWSPLGDWLIYDSGAAGRIYLVRPDGSYNTLIANLPQGINSQPSFSPDGAWIVFVNWYNSQADLYIIHADGSDLTRVTNDTIVESDPGWMSNSMLVFVGDSGIPGINQIYTLTIDPPGPPFQLITFKDDGLNASPFLSPDGKTLVFARSDSSAPGWDIWTAHSNGATPGAAGIPLNSIDAELQPVWSRDGANILFLSDRTTPGTFQLYYGSELSVSLIPDGFNNEINPRWMP